MDSHQQLERAPGRPLAERDRDSVPNLNDVSDALLADARTALAQTGSSVAVHLFLPQYCGRENFRHLGGFIQDVVRGSEPAAQRGLGDRARVSDTTINCCTNPATPCSLPSTVTTGCGCRRICRHGPEDPINAARPPNPCTA